jgi:hypothetical protein
VRLPPTILLLLIVYAEGGGGRGEEAAGAGGGQSGGRGAGGVGLLPAVEDFRAAGGRPFAGGYNGTAGRRPSVGITTPANVGNIRD